MPVFTENGDVVIPSECYHIAILTERGIAFGLEQRANFMESLGATIFGVVNKSQLYLHDMIAQLVSKSVDDARSYARTQQQHPYFGHAMEVLLHRVLAKEWDKMEPTSDRALLPIVVNFLRSFPDFMEVVVRCARKTELEMWGYLFAIVGDPRTLFEVCFVCLFLF